MPSKSGDFFISNFPKRSLSLFKEIGSLFGERLPKTFKLIGYVFKRDRGSFYCKIIFIFDKIKMQSNKQHIAKHYYASTQRSSGNLGSSENIGVFDCDWLIIPFGGQGC
jgi:hypothetical protein